MAWILWKCVLKQVYNSCKHLCAVLISGKTIKVQWNTNECYDTRKNLTEKEFNDCSLANQKCVPGPHSYQFHVSEPGNIYLAPSNQQCSKGMRAHIEVKHQCTCRSGRSFLTQHFFFSPQILFPKIYL